MQNPRQTSEHEYELRDDQNLLSRTDLQGRITYAAPGFIEASGYSLEELLGAPHNIVRHPDMPHEAFANFWETIKRGEIWTGLVKNRRKNGDYYWVRANVTPIMENGELQGYSSVRVKVSPEERAEAERIYAQIRAGKARGIRLVRGQITRTGPLGRLRQLNPASLRLRLHGMVALNLLLLLACAGLSYFGYREAGESIRQLQALASDGASSGLLADLQEQQRSLLHTQLAFLVLVGGLLLGTGSLVLRSFLRQMHEAIGFAMQIATGNLAASAPRIPASELGRLLEMLAIMRNSLGNIVTDVYRCLDAVRPAAESIAGGNSGLAARSEQQASALQQTAASMEQITATVQQNADNARQACGLANAAADEVRTTGSTVGELVSSMGRISGSSAQIAQIIQVIDGIAFQTNILALNASVGAGRAGGHGRGFAVVANEVRRLASRSAEAAHDIRGLIEEARQEVLTGEQQVQRAASAIQRVADSVVQVNDIVGEITAASGEQAHGIEQVNQAVAQLDDVTQRNAELVQNSARDAADLDAQVAQLVNVISVLRTGGREQVAAARAPVAAPAAARQPGRSVRVAQPQPQVQRPTPIGDEWLAF